MDATAQQNEKKKRDNSKPFNYSIIHEAAYALPHRFRTPPPPIACAPPIVHKNLRGSPEISAPGK